MDPITAEAAKKAPYSTTSALAKNALPWAKQTANAVTGTKTARVLGAGMGAVQLADAALNDTNPDGTPKSTITRANDAIVGGATMLAAAPNPLARAVGWLAKPINEAGTSAYLWGHKMLNPNDPLYAPGMPSVRELAATPVKKIEPQAPQPTALARPQATSTGSRVSVGDSMPAAPRLQTAQIAIPKAPEAAISQEAAARLALQAAQGGMWAAPVAGAIAGVGQREANRVFKQDMARRQLEQQGVDSANRDALALYGDQARVAAARYSATKDLAQQMNITQLMSAYADARLRGDNAKAGIYNGMIRALTGNAPEQYSYIKPENIGEKGSLMDAYSGRVVPLQNNQPGIYTQPDGSTIVIDGAGRRGVYPAGTKVPGYANGGLIDTPDMGDAQPPQQAIPVAGKMLDGPGTETSDSLPAVIDGTQPAALSKGEYVIPADVVRAKGTEFFDKLLSGVRAKAQPEAKAEYANGGPVVPPAPQMTALPATMQPAQPPQQPSWQLPLSNQTVRSPVATIGIRG